MKFTIPWLRDHLNTDASIDAIVSAMTMAGLEVESVHNPADDLKAFTVAKIIEAVQHPNADRLRVCQVETVDGKKEIVCGAPNARAGLTTIYAPLGTYIPGSGITLEARPVRGVVSNGMLCSGAELQIDADGDGIIELPENPAVGTSAAQALGLGDAVIDFEVTPNRPDWLGVEGIARDLGAAGVGLFKESAPKAVPGKFPCPIHVSVDRSACPLFAGRAIKGVKNGPSPAWLQARLKAIGLRPINALVDVTNYISYDRARPLHVYDMDTIAGRYDGARPDDQPGWFLEARLGQAGETLDALDGKTYEITPEMCVIADAKGPVGLGGVMGGVRTGCSEHTDEVFVESALFDPLRTFQTGRATGINSDARYRFERGVDPAFVVPGLELATRLIIELCGGAPSEMVVAGSAPAARAPILFDHDRVRKLAGLDVSLARVRAILKALGFSATPSGQTGKKLLVAPPSWRGDVEGQADLVEEVARIEGYDKLAAPAPSAGGARRPAASVGESRTRLARRALAGAGYLEAITWSFCDETAAKAFGGAAPALTNPIAADLSTMRPSALPNLLRAAQRNLDRGHGDAKLFECGPAFSGAREADQRRTVAAVWQPQAKRHWQGVRTPDLFDVKRDCLLALEAIGAPSALQSGPASDAWWHPGKAGVLRLGAKTVAAFGEFHPRTLGELGVEGPALGFEIWLDALPAPRAKGTRAKPALALVDLMPLRRDFAFLVEEGTPAADLVRAAAGADKTLIADVALFDVYRGPGVPDGKKSLAIEVTLQPTEKTLNDADIEALSQKVIAAAAKSLGASLRT
jgi:phenylalanyl-tRNA synthetase beta chain